MSQGSDGGSHSTTPLSEDTFPAFHFGTVSIPAFFFTYIVALVLFSVTVIAKINPKEREDERKADSEPGNVRLDTPDDSRWEAPTLGWELLRMTGFLAPMSFFFCLVDFCSACLPWLPYVPGQPESAPRIDGGGIFGGFLFLIVWCWRSFPKDTERAFRRPRETFKRESWFCAESAAWSLMIVVGIFVLYHWWVNLSS